MQILIVSCKPLPTWQGVYICSIDVYHIFHLWDYVNIMCELNIRDYLLHAITLIQLTKILIVCVIYDYFLVNNWSPKNVNFLLVHYWKKLLVTGNVCVNDALSGIISFKYRHFNEKKNTLMIAYNNHFQFLI